MPQKRKDSPPDFEKTLGELEAIVEKMEHGEQALEESLQDFERGMELARNCQESLKKAEQRVEKLVKKNKDFEFQPYDPEEP